ncbi:MAG: MnmC family methyltransferase [Verrucomicrobiota bacterium]|nr:MnmC family methyltransferase [Limisphaera sp.]MDW8381832.1 MnmC family methyltransferase [Verrucomicrobiota bacterium]
MSFEQNGFFELVQVSAGVWALRDCRLGEVMHPGAGPENEAWQLHVEQLQLPRLFKRIRHRPVVIWDVGLGGAANALAILRAASSQAVRLCLWSFDVSLTALRFARVHAEALGYLAGFESLLDEFLGSGRYRGRIGNAQVDWVFVEGDFRTFLGNRDCRGPGPDGVAYDPFSPRRDPALWTLDVFQQLRERLEPEHPCVLTTYSRSNRVRTAMLLAGWFVGHGRPVEGKEETTVAASELTWLDRPLDGRWLERMQQVLSKWPPHWGDPLLPWSADRIWEALRGHPQFCSGV